MKRFNSFLALVVGLVACPCLPPSIQAQSAPTPATSGAGPETTVAPQVGSAAMTARQRQWAHEALRRLEAARVLDGHERELLTGDRPITSRDLAIIVGKLAQYASEWRTSDGRVFGPDDLAHITSRTQELRGSLDATGSRLTQLQDDIQSLRHDLEEIRRQLHERRRHTHDLPAGTISRE